MTETWGLLDKSQSDSQKIDNAISEAIADHESDPEAHLGEGDSLQSHKASEIIDHLARSVYTDKFAYDRFQFLTNFESVDSWSKTVGSILYGVGDFTIFANLAQGRENYAHLFHREYFEDFGPCEANGFFDSVLYCHATDNFVAYFGFVGVDDLSGGMQCGAGFKVVNGAVYGAYNDDGIAETVVDLDYSLDDGYHRFQIEIKDSVCSWYIDEVLKYTCSSSDFVYTNTFAGYYIKNTAGAGRITVVRLCYEQDLPSSA